MKTTKSNISALMITFNEIDHIEDVIRNLDFADEIIVIDSHSTDGTFEKLSSRKHIESVGQYS